MFREKRATRLKIKSYCHLGFRKHEVIIGEANRIDFRENVEHCSIEFEKMTTKEAISNESTL